jgi:hypothetical protein
MEINSSIRQCFRNDPNNNDLPKPIFARQVNGPDAPIINCKNKHNKLMKLMADELSEKYILYNERPHES